MFSVLFILKHFFHIDINLHLTYTIINNCNCYTMEYMNLYVFKDIARKGNAITNGDFYLHSRRQFITLKIE